MSNIIYLSYDADSAGSKIGQAILADDVNMLNEFSEKINLGNEIISRWAKSMGGVQYSSGGDQGVFAIPAESIEEIETLRKDYEFATGLTITVGLGNTLSESGKALIVGKFRGKNQVVMYGPDIDQEIQQSSQKVQEGTASFEEQKLGQAYLKPEDTQMAESELGQKPNESGQNQDELGHQDCPFCEDTAKIGDDNCPFCQDNAEFNHDPNELDHDPDCPFCQENEAAEHNPDEPNHDPNCPFCQENAAQAEHNPDEPGHDPDCPFCQENVQEGAVGGDDQGIVPTAGPDSVSLPTTTTSENFAGQDLQSPDSPKPDAISDNPDGLGSTSVDEPTVENMKIDGNLSPNPKATDALPPEQQDAAAGESTQDILQQIDAIPGAQAPQTGDPELEDGVSRPPGFPEDVPGDLGLTEDIEEEQAPDITGVLQEGLDSHADNIQRERVVQMVGEALAGFKECKNIIERAQQQAPQLYAASLSMLKAMIEMAKMLGLDQDQEQSMENPLESDDQGLSQEVAPGPGLAAPQSAPQSAPQAKDASQRPEPPADPKPKG